MDSTKKIVWLFIFCLIIASGVYYAVSIYSPNDNEHYTNISISAKDGKERIETGFEIRTSNGVITGNTEYTYQLFKVPQEEIYIKNINFLDQNYYEIERKYNVSDGFNRRIDILLEKVILPEVNIEKSIENEIILLTLSNGNFHKVDFCIDGSSSYMFLDAPNFNETDKPSDFNSYEVCYFGNFSITSTEEKQIEITYTTLLEPGENDYIEVAFIDYQGNVLEERII